MTEKKTASKKTVKKVEPTTTKKKVVKKTDSKKAETNVAKIYHVAKRAKDNKWQVKAAKGEKAIKLFDTKDEAMEYVKKMAANQEAGVLVHVSKGKYKGKLRSK